MEGEKVYIHNDKYVWLPATVLERNGDKAKVRIELPDNWCDTTSTTKKQAHLLHLKEDIVDLNNYSEHRIPLQNETTVRDMAELPHLHEAAILYQIKNRHFQRQPYTRIGDIIIAMNPCELIPELYSTNEQRKYAKSFVWQGRLIKVKVWVVAISQFCTHTVLFMNS